MKILINQLPKSTIEDFADAHDLTMIVSERSNHSKYTASFENTETKESQFSSILETDYGHGNTVDEAIKNYAKNISGQLLVVNASSRQYRREIDCPIFIN